MIIIVRRKEIDAFRLLDIVRFYVVCLEKIINILVED